jgi:hypothetical protein
MAAPLHHAAAFLFVTGSSLAPAGGRGRSPLAASRRHITRAHSLERREFRRALDRAYAAFARRHPAWVASLFDRHLLTSTLEPVLYEGHRRGAPPAPAVLARAWAEQFGPASAGRQGRRAFEALAVAADFLAGLDAEL